MIIDITGIKLMPGNGGKECPGSWKFAGDNCCCDGCDYMLCCLDTHDSKECVTCMDKYCPHSDVK